MKTEIKELENSEIEIVGEIPIGDLDKYQKEALKKLGENTKMPGFRKGHIPENILIKQIGDQKLLEETAQVALKKTYPEIIKKNKIEAIGLPEITITKIAKGNPLGFKIKTAIIPKIEIPNHRKIAKEIGSPSEKIEIKVDEKEIENTILQIRKMRAQTSTPSNDGKTKEDSPELDDEFVRLLGNFKDVKDFREKLKENIKVEKRLKIRDKNRLKIMEKIIEETKIELPRILIDIEINKMIHQLKHDLSHAGMELEDYLKNIKKTEEDIRKEWTEDAKKRSKLQLIAYQIAKDEEIKVSEEEIQKQVNLIMDTHKEADPDRARAYIENVLTNEKVFQLLENQALENQK